VEEAFAQEVESCIGDLRSRGYGCLFDYEHFFSLLVVIDSSVKELNDLGMEFGEGHW